MADWVSSQVSLQDQCKLPTALVNRPWGLTQGSGVEGLRGTGRPGKAGEVEHSPVPASSSALHNQEMCWLCPPTQMSFQDRDLVPTSQLAARGPHLPQQCRPRSSRAPGLPTAQEVGPHKQSPPTLTLQVEPQVQPSHCRDHKDKALRDWAPALRGPSGLLQGTACVGPGRPGTGPPGSSAHGTLGQALQTKPDRPVAFRYSLCVWAFLFSLTACTGSVSQRLFPF